LECNLAGPHYAITEYMASDGGVGDVDDDDIVDEKERRVPIEYYRLELRRKIFIFTSL
jgi:hypothetical protein